MKKPADPSKTKAPARKKQNEALDEAIRESFPASDPPAWTASHTGRPDRKKDK